MSIRLRTVAAALVAIFALVVATKVRATRGLAPTSRHLEAFVSTMPDDARLALFERGGDKQIVCIGPRAPLYTFPSGPAAYVFDETGALVDWTADLGDSPDRFTDLQTARGTPLTRDEALALVHQNAKNNP
ncbi:MAG: hypothetical protein U0271_05245 [Polyangiaceae bacterium]